MIRHRLPVVDLLPIRPRPILIRPAINQFYNAISPRFADLCSSGPTQGSLTLNNVYIIHVFTTTDVHYLQHSEITVLLTYMLV